jgi:signal transduction histidine kinase
MENRAVKMDRRTVNLKEILIRAVDQHEARIRQQNVTVGYHYDPDAEIADVDPTRIEQVFVNLLANALQYGARANGEIRITARRRGGEIEINFADDGPGIPYEDQPHIFERFYRVHKDRSRDAGGTGLGLSIVKNVALAHGGHVSVRSTPGSGSNFRVVLPITAPPHS